MISLIDYTPAFKNVALVELATDELQTVRRQFGNGCEDIPDA